MMVNFLLEEQSPTGDALSKELSFIRSKGSLSIGAAYLPKVGPIKAGWRNMAAVPRKVPRPSGAAKGGPEPL